MPNEQNKESESIPPHRHRFIDEAGDMTFYGKKRKQIIGQDGVSNTFMLGMVKVACRLHQCRTELRDLAQSVLTDRYFAKVPSVSKRADSGFFVFHAKNDPPEIRKIMFDYIANLDCSFEAVVARKSYERFAFNHNDSEQEFYADLLAQLLHNKLGSNNRLVLNIAQRGSSTRHHNLQVALLKAEEHWQHRYKRPAQIDGVVFNVQPYTADPLLAVADYCCWTVQRYFERNESRYFEFLENKMSLVTDIGVDGKKVYYNKSNPLLKSAS